jgi:hypothetical protein
VIVDVPRCRIIVTYEAKAHSVTADAIIKVLTAMPAPQNK